MGGHALHGGFGLSSHTHGLTLDAMIEAKVVLANNSFITASTTQNYDIFWAVRGAGSSFGIVTSFKFQAFPAPSSNIVFNYTFAYNDLMLHCKPLMHFLFCRNM
jgi:FAD/FMN-containing dehydrogenase